MILLLFLIVSCKNNQGNKNENQLGTVPITTSSEKAREHFEKARHLVQNGLNNDPEEYYKKAIELGGTCEGEPNQRGPRYSAYVRDLDKNKLVFGTSPE